MIDSILNKRITNIVKIRTINYKVTNYKHTFSARVSHEKSYIDVF